MCGIVAVATSPARRSPPSPAELLDPLQRAVEIDLTGAGVEELAGRLSSCAEHLEVLDALLRGSAGVRALLGAADLQEQVVAGIDEISGRARALEAELERGALGAPGSRLEQVNEGLVRLKDLLWAVRQDRVCTARATGELARGVSSEAGIDVYLGIQVALQALERLEVRGRDSAGLHVLLRDHGLGNPPETHPLWRERASDGLFRSNAVRCAEGVLSFVYKAAAEIGELGDNIAALRLAIDSDELLRAALDADGARATVVAHTRWASVGLISEANAHPLTSEEASRTNPYVVAALNGDVDNHVELVEAEGLDAPVDITTDAKVIPVLFGRRLGEGIPSDEAFLQTVAELEGSVAITAACASAPGSIYCALRGSGQALYVGLAEDMFVVASEPYGLVEQAGSYLRLEGEATRTAAGAEVMRGQVVVVDDEAAGTLDGLRRYAYDGTVVPVSEEELQRPDMTTRDIDRGAFRHYLLKEISEAPRSFRKTLQGRIVEVGGRQRVQLGDDVVPELLQERLRSGDVRKVVVIGQGTAAVAGRGVAAAFEHALAGTGIVVEAMAATELSGFNLDEDMTGSLVVAVSQSGTTTDTLRTVEVARARGALVVSIVNRRRSDLTDRSDGVLYNSDGRDVEMAVPSTKAFYAQVAAGFLLAFAVAQHAGVEEIPDEQAILSGLRELPGAMERVLALQETLGSLAQRHAPGRRYWAVVGNGPNRIAAEEVRIKLSELCYKAIPCDLTEDKKHIDLSSEPLIFVCAAGLSGSMAEDVAKEVAIYRAHKAVPVVIADESQPALAELPDAVAVPSVHPELDYILATVAGHLFGYEAALAIDAQALPLREARSAIQSVVAEPAANGLLERLSVHLEGSAARFFEGLRSGSYDGHLEASTAVRISSLLRYALGLVPLDAFEVEHGRIGSPGTVVQELAEALTAGIDQLTRPIDAIKHQAKTVTVGVTRAEETLLQAGLVRSVLAAGASRDGLSYSSLRTLAALDPTVEEVTGYTRYRVEGDPHSGRATIQVLDRGGIARELESRAGGDGRLRGSKARVAAEREPLVTRGRSDGRSVVIVPETKGGEVTGITLLHLSFRDRLPAAVMRGVLKRYRDRYAALRDLVTETEPEFREELLGEMDVFELLVASIQALAERWRDPGAR